MPSFQQFDCVHNLQFEAPLSTGSVYNLNLPALATQTLSDIAGEITSPASGAVFTYSTVGSEWTASVLSISNEQVLTTDNSPEETSTASQGGSGSTVAGSRVEGSVATGTLASRTSGGAAIATACKSEVGDIGSGPFLSVKNVCVLRGSHTVGS